MTQAPLNATLAVDSFGLSAKPIQEVDLRALHALSMIVSWPHRAEDWQFLLQLGQGLAAVDESGRVHATGMWFPFGDDFATIGMMITTPRLQTGGGGAWLSRHMMHQAEGRAIGLHATQASYRMFRNFGFHDEGTVFQHQGIAAIPPEIPALAQGQVRAMTPVDRAAILALDETTTGTDRSAMFAALNEVCDGMVLEHAGKIKGYAMSRGFGRGTVIGPVLAASDEEAVALVRPLVERRAGHFVRLDTGLASGAFRRFLTLSGLAEFDRVTRMSLGPRWPYSYAPPVMLYALAAQSIG